MTTTLLYVHGLESGPQGRKTAMLERAGFRVASERMPCGRADLVGDPALWGVGAAAMVAVGASTLVAGRKGLALSLGVAVAAGTLVPSRLMRRMFERSIAVQLRALGAHSIDAVVGSSFGSAVALELLLRGAWAGPTLLLCPAHELVATRARLPAPRTLASLPQALAERVLVVHGTADETVPVEHSERLVAGSRAALLLVDDDHRLHKTSTAEGLTALLARIDVHPEMPS